MNKFEANKNKSYHQGFTLAEVLIVIGIIGVVASMTISTLVKNYQKKVFGIRVKKAYTTLYQAIKLSENVNGDIADWNFNLSNNNLQNSKLFVETYIQPFIKGLQYCDTGMTNNECAKYVGCGNAGVNYHLPNGSMLGVCAYPGDKNVWLKIAVNKQKDNYKRGASFAIDKTTYKFVPSYYYSDLSRNAVLNGFKPLTDNYTVACDKTGRKSQYPYHACSALLYVDNFEVTDDYPW